MIIVILTNATQCRIYDYKKNTAELMLLKELDHPEGRLKDSELVSDAPGKYHVDPSSAHGAYEPAMSAKEIENDQFSRLIAKDLNQERQKNGMTKIFPRKNLSRENKFCSTIADFVCFQGSSNHDGQGHIQLLVCLLSVQLKFDIKETMRHLRSMDIG